jgi:uracil-DNA glycosylase
MKRDEAYWQRKAAEGRAALIRDALEKRFLELGRAGAKAGRLASVPPRILIIGEAPSPSGPAGEPLSGKCGGRLAALCGLSLPEFLETFERTNLFAEPAGRAGKGSAFPPLREARARAETLRAGFPGRRVVFLGKRVARAFGIRPCRTPVRMPACTMPFRWVGNLHGWPPQEWTGKAWVPAGLAWCPHPSGVNRFWNEPENVERARRFWTELAAWARAGL